MSTHNGLNGHTGHTGDSKDGVSVSTDIHQANSISDIKAALSSLHAREATVTARLDSLLSSQKEFQRELGRLDILRAHLSSQTNTTRSISNGMLSEASSTASRISGAVKRLDLEQSRVKATLEVVEQVAELKACVLGVTGSMGAPQDWETAATYLNRANKIPKEIVEGTFAGTIVPTAEVPDPPSVTLENAAGSLCGLFLREFDKAVKEGNGAKITRFFKLFPLIGRAEVGLDVYGRYVCQGVATRARGNLNALGKKNAFFYSDALTKLFEHIAQIIESHGSLVETHYGAGSMVKVIERLQIEADVQGGIILDSWSDDRSVDRKLTDIKSYAFTFLVQSFLPAQRGTGGTPRANSPAVGRPGTPAGRSSEDEGVDMKEVDGLLNEMGMMLGRWSLYTRFLAEKCKVGLFWPFIRLALTYPGPLPIFRRLTLSQYAGLHIHLPPRKEDLSQALDTLQHHDHLLLPAIRRKGIPARRGTPRSDAKSTQTPSLKPTPHHVCRRRHHVHCQENPNPIPPNLPDLRRHFRHPHHRPCPLLRLHRHDPTQDAR
jgi:conserved oligomeric Golgi complex subunit 4